MAATLPVRPLGGGPTHNAVPRPLAQPIGGLRGAPARPHVPARAKEAASGGDGQAGPAGGLLRRRDVWADNALGRLPSVGKLLYGAATRLDRGTSTCLQCRGTGAVECLTCKGTGLAETRKGKLSGLKKVVGKVKGLFGHGEEASDAGFVLSNRCRRCHGLGRTTCPACGGLGVRATRGQGGSKWGE